ncbi:MAG TPA: hypothetical protein VG818_03525 [Gemmatimonadaceae bacterium]|nr:hypothetical protein [Gemmatimonadaceae bacterium]
MALTMSRWVVIACLACAAIAAWKLPARDEDVVAHMHFGGMVQLTDGRTVRAGSPDAGARIRSDNTKLRLLALRDSIMRAGAATSTSDHELEVVHSTAIPDSIATKFAAATRGQWSRLGAGGHHPVTVALVFDSLRAFNGLPVLPAGQWVSSVTFLPGEATHGRCLIVARIGVSIWNAKAPTWQRARIGDLTSSQTAAALLSPCALVGTFGMPGPHVAGWLRATGWQLAHSAAWDGRSAPFHSSTPLPFTLWQVTPHEQQAWIVRQYMPDNAIRCMGGDTTACETAVTHPPVQNGDAAWDSATVGNRERPEWAWWAMFNYGIVGPNQGSFISDVIHDMGRERFGQFWRSSLPVDSAFASAMHESWGSWTQAWMWRVYGRDTRGPALPDGTAPIVLAFLALSVAIATALAARRQVK